MRWFGVINFLWPFLSFPVCATVTGVTNCATCDGKECQSCTSGYDLSFDKTTCHGTLVLIWKYVVSSFYHESLVELLFCKPQTMILVSASSQLANCAVRQDRTAECTQCNSTYAYLAREDDGKIKIPMRCQSKSRHNHLLTATALLLSFEECICYTEIQTNSGMR